MPEKKSGFQKMRGAWHRVIQTEVKKMSKGKTNFQKVRNARYREVDRRTAGIKQKYEAEKAALGKRMKALEEGYRQRRQAAEAAAVGEENEAVMAAFERGVRRETLDEKKKSIEHDIRSIAWRMGNEGPGYLDGIRRAIFEPPPGAKK